MEWENKRQQFPVAVTGPIQRQGWTGALVGPTSINATRAYLVLRVKQPPTTGTGIFEGGTITPAMVMKQLVWDTDHDNVTITLG